VHAGDTLGVCIIIVVVVQAADWASTSEFSFSHLLAMPRCKEADTASTQPTKYSRPHMTQSHSWLFTYLLSVTFADTNLEFLANKIWWWWWWWWWKTENVLTQQLAYSQVITFPQASSDMSTNCNSANKLMTIKHHYQLLFQKYFREQSKPIWTLTNITSVTPTNIGKPGSLPMHLLSDIWDVNLFDSMRQLVAAKQTANLANTYCGSKC